MNSLNKLWLHALVMVSLVSGCGGHGSDALAPSAPALTLGGTAAVGAPIVGATITVTCAAGSTLPTTTTSATGAWQVTLTGQTLPCAAQVSGGSIRGAPNTLAYHSVAIAAGTLNVSPLTDLVVANLSGVATTSAWFGSLRGASATSFNAINATAVAASLAQVRSALALPALNNINPLTVDFNPVSGNAMDDVLTALQAAITTTSTSLAALSTAAAGPTFIAPVGFSGALASGFAGTTSGAGTGPTRPNPPTGASATAASATQINLSWTAVSGATSYNIYRSSAASVAIAAANKINASAVTTSSYNDTTGLSASTAYFYKVTAVNSAGESTTGSNEVTATTSAAAVSGGGGSSGLTFSPAFGGVSAIADAAPTVTPISEVLGGGTVLSYTGGLRIATRQNQGVEEFNLTFAGSASSALNNGGFTFAPGSCALAANAAGAPLCSSFGITFNKATGTVSFVNTPMGTGLSGNAPTVFTINGTLTFPATASGGTSVTGQMGGAIQSTALALTGTVTTPFGLTYLGQMTTDGTNLYIADGSFYRVTKLNLTTGTQTTLAGALTITAGNVDGTGAAAQFSSLSGITTDGTNLYVSDVGNHSIRKIVIATGVVTTLAGSGTAGSADGTGTAATFNQPNGITTDNTNLYVADFLNNKIRKIVISTGVVTTLAGSGIASRVDGTGAAATFSNPYVLTTDGTNLYESDLFGGSIRKIVIATGAVTTLALSASGLDVRGITTDGTNLYVLDNNNSKVVKKIVIATGTVSVIAGGGSSPQSIADGVGTAAKFSAPRAITTNGSSLFVADSQDLRKIQ